MTDNRRSILELGNPLLRRNALTVTRFSGAALNRLVSDMLQTMHESNGVGLAAPQLGESLRIIVVASRPTPRYPRAPVMAPRVMINPDFDIVNDGRVKDWEGCLSIPGIRALVPRYQSVRVRCQKMDGQTDTLLLEDFAARVFQHEYDHLQGLVYLDRVDNNQDIISESEYLKLIH